MKIHWLQHVPFEGLEYIETWARLNDCRCARTRLYAGDALPDLQDFDWLIAMGGPMGVHSTAQCAWLADEKRLIERAIHAGKAVLGVCFGAQLIADVLGSRVYRNRDREIGWHKVFLTDDGVRSPLVCGVPPSFLAFHWHGDTFDIPSGGARLATSAACENQAFQYGDRVLGLQFHLEVGRASIEAMIAHCRDDLVATRYVQAPAEMLAQVAATSPGLWRVMGQVLTNVSKSSRMLQQVM